MEDLKVSEVELVIGLGYADKGGATYTKYWIWSYYSDLDRFDRMLCIQRERRPSLYPDTIMPCRRQYYVRGSEDDHRAVMCYRCSGLSINCPVTGRDRPEYARTWDMRA